jgi:hypothetical protein
MPRTCPLFYDACVSFGRHAPEPLQPIYDGVRCRGMIRPDIASRTRGKRQKKSYRSVSRPVEDVACETKMILAGEACGS